MGFFSSTLGAASGLQRPGFGAAQRETIVPTRGRRGRGQLFPTAPARSTKPRRRFRFRLRKQGGVGGSRLATSY